MTVKQFRKKVEIARRCGSAVLTDGDILHYFRGFRTPWSIRDRSGNTIDVADDPADLEYLFE